MLEQPSYFPEITEKKFELPFILQTQESKLQ